MIFTRIWTAFNVLLATASCTELILPSQDPWYTAPDGYEAQIPGTILRSREAPSNLTFLANNSAGAYQLLFRSTDARYRPAWAVTTVFLPTNASQAGRDLPALLSYQIPYNTINVDYSPSYGLSTIYGEPLMGNVREGLSRGWAVSVPDFEGPQAAFTAGPQAGHAVLDSVRAVLSFRNLGKSRSVLWGYSGGALASGFAAELQASYAPELEIAGVSLGGQPSNFTQVIYTANESPTSAIVPYALIGVTAQYPEERQYLVDHLHQEDLYNATTFLSALQIPVNDAIMLFSGQNIFDYFTNGEDIMRAPELAKVFGNNWFAGFHGIPQMPVFAYKAINDVPTKIETTDEHVHRMCGVGANVLYQRNTVGGHEEEGGSAGNTRALEWLGKALDGQQLEPQSGCLIEDVTVGA